MRVALLASVLILAAGCTSRSTAPRIKISKEPISYASRTIVFHDAGHGTQIEYFSPQGKAYLWYPGNTGVVIGDWKRQGQNICFRYGPNTYNPITKTSGGRWQCRASFRQRYSAKQACAGDPFGLASGNVPYRLTKEAYKSPRIMKLCTGEV